MAVAVERRKPYADTGDNKSLLRTHINVVLSYSRALDTEVTGIAFSRFRRFMASGSRDPLRRL